MLDITLKKVMIASFPTHLILNDAKETLLLIQIF
jgi:hypothetical protein